MPGKIKVRIICARNLPIMDRSSESSDAFVEVRLGTNHYDKTPVFKKSLDPEWNSRFVFEVEEDEIQEEPLQIRVLDHDTYSSHDAIGKVYIDLKPLVNTNGPSSIIGWFPIYDTMHGIRGEIKIQAKVEIFNDFNEYRKSSCGVQFFCSNKIPDGYILQNFCGFVEELVINDDPEYQWIDKIRTPRTSNETRQKLFSKLSGELQRRIGLKVLEMSGNCVLGYMQNFDLEGEHGIVVRGIGTVAFIYKNSLNTTPNSANGHTSSHATPSAPMTASVYTSNNSKFFNFNTNSNNNSTNTNVVPNIVLPKEEQLVKNNNNTNINKSNQLQNITNMNGLAINTNQQTPGLNDVYNLKMNKLSPTARSNLVRIHSDSDLNSYHFNHQLVHTNQIAAFNFVKENKLFKKENALQLNNQNKLHQYDNSNLKDLNKSILDKQEYPFFTIQQYPIGFVRTICGIVCARSVKLLSAMTSEDELDARDKWWIEIRNEIRSHMKALSCHIVLGYTETKSIYEDVCVLSASGTACIVDETFFLNTNLIPNYSDENTAIAHINNFNDLSIKNCKLCHVPYSEQDLPFPVTLSQCAICGNGLVPDIIMSSVQPLPEIETIGQGCLLRAVVTRPHKKCNGEISAKKISDFLPFMEYELHRQLLGKLKLKGMNFLYGLRVQISIGENLVTGLAEATACKVAALPESMIPKILSEKNIDKSSIETEEINKLVKMFTNELNENKQFFNLNSLPKSNGSIIPKLLTIKNDINEQQSDQKSGLFKIELDDVREKDEIYLLFDSTFNKKKGFYACSTEYMPGIPKFNENVQMFTSVYRCETSLVQMNTTKFNEICDEILKSLQYKFRKYPNCCLSNLSFDNSLYDDDHAMIIITGCCLTFDDKQQQKDDVNNLKPPHTIKSNLKQTDCKNVELTNLSYVPNARIENYYGNVNLFLIRESTQIKENGGLSGFMHCFISEVLALSRAHVLSLGGNALVSFKMNECVLLDNPHRNQGQCLINISGDAVKVQHFK